MFHTIGGHRMFIVDIGSGARTFLAHSGWIGTFEDWLPTIEILSRQWRTVAHDHRGAGETVVPLYAISAKALVDDIFQIMDELAIKRCIMGGFSAGTLPALQAVIRAPERFEGLVLANGSAGVMAPGTSPKAVPKPSGWPGKTHAEHLRWFVERCTPEPDSEHIRRWAFNILMRAEPEAAEKLFRMGFPAGSDVTGHLQEVRMPTLLLHGELDPFCSLEAMEYLVEQLPDATLEVITGAGHLPLMSQPQRMAALIEARFSE